MAGRLFLGRQLCCWEMVIALIHDSKGGSCKFLRNKQPGTHFQSAVGHTQYARPTSMLSQASSIPGLILMNKSSSIPYCTVTAKQLSPSFATTHFPQLLVVPLPVNPGGATVAVAYGDVCVAMAPGTVEGVYSS